MSTLARRLLPAVFLSALACSRAPAAASAPSVARFPARQTAAMPAYVDSVDVRPVARSVVLCKTTADDLRRQLGQPTRDGRLHGSQILSWSTRSESPSRYMAVLVDSRGVVADLYWDVPVEVKWDPTDQCAHQPAR